MMTAEAYVAGRQRRERRASHVALAIVAGLIGAVAISLIAGSRRSSTVVDRYFDTAPGYDVLVGSRSLNREQRLAVDGVELVAPSAYLALNVVRDEGKSSIDGLIVDFAIPWPLLGLVTAIFVAGGIVSATTIDTRRRRSHLATQLHTE
jgi:hypothetical protein